MRIDIRSEVGGEIDQIQYGNHGDEYVELLCYSVDIMDCYGVIVNVSGVDVRNLAKALTKAADLKGW